MKNNFIVILSFVDLLIRNCSKFQMELLLPIKNATKLLMFTVSDWIDNTKLESNAFMPILTSFEVDDAVHEITSLLKSGLQNKSLKLQTKGILDLPTLNTDRSRFQQVLLNLITNAIKFAPKASTIEVRFEFNSRAERLSVLVKDQGLGMTPE